MVLKMAVGIRGKFILRVVRVSITKHYDFPLSKRGKKLNEKFIETTNLMLETGGFLKMSPTLLSDLRKQDREFEREVKARRRKRRKSWISSARAQHTYTFSK